MRTWVQSLALLSGVRIPHCSELWWRSQRKLRSGVAVAMAVAGSWSSNSTPSPGTYICHRSGPKKQKKKKKKSQILVRLMKKIKQFDEIQGLDGLLWLDLPKKVLFHFRSK